MAHFRNGSESKQIENQVGFLKLRRDQARGVKVTISIRQIVIEIAQERP